MNEPGSLGFALQQHHVMEVGSVVLIFSLLSQWRTQFFILHLVKSVTQWNFLDTFLASVLQLMLKLSYASFGTSFMAIFNQIYIVIILGI